MMMKMRNILENRVAELILIGVITMVVLSSCGTSQLTQKQIEINYKLDRLWIDYKYESDSLINEFYKK